MLACGSIADTGTTFAVLATHWALIQLNINTRQDAIVPYSLPGYVFSLAQLTRGYPERESDQLAQILAEQSTDGKIVSVLG